MAHNYFQSPCEVSSGGLIGRGPRVRDVMDEGRSGIEGACLPGVDGNVRVGVTARARSLGEPIIGEVGSGGGKMVMGAGADRGLYDAFWSRGGYKDGAVDTGDG